MPLVLFLGYDGCLHAVGVRHTNGAPVHHVEGHKLFEWANVLATQLEQYPNVRVVLHTAWAKIYGFEKARDFLPESLKSRVIGTTHQFFTEPIEWASLTEFDQIMRYVDAYGLKRWVALSTEKYYWPEAFTKNRVWLNKLKGLGEIHAQEQLAERLQWMCRWSASAKSLQLHAADGKETLQLCWNRALEMLADARIAELSDRTRFQAAYDAVCYFVRIFLAMDPLSCELTVEDMLDKLSVEYQVDQNLKTHVISLLETWEPNSYDEPKILMPSDTEAVLAFAEACRGWLARSLQKS
ncbi:MAG: hypothetical protein LBV05_16895 [Comamonas sp.]|jgi:hypothetical protein|uniref:HAD domain-containing protein n=1 Tax=Comamonas sp. TaxID=34028 RepID=UPI00284579CF|nr:HAD domain-containing protein [Comamonas sp.]MDR3067166.1 hypothetical protein [Comamonas sp.]